MENIDPTNPSISNSQSISLKPTSKFHFFSKIRNHGKLLLLLIIIFIILPTSVFVLNQFTNKQQSHNQAQKFGLSQSSPVDQDSTFSTSGQPTFVFSKNIGIAESDLGKYFHISPTVPGSWHVEKNGQVVYFSSNKTQADGFPNTFSYNTVYTVTIDKSFHSSDNHALPNNVTISFRTKQNPSFGLQADYKLMNTTPNKSLAITFTDSNSLGSTNQRGLAGTPVKVSIQMSNENQLLQYFSYEDGKYPLYQFVPDSNTNVRELQSVLEQAQSDEYQIELANDAFSSPGIYYVKVSNAQGNEDLFVVASNHINQVFNDAQNTYVWASEEDTGKSISGVTTEFVKAKKSPVLLDKIITDSDGIAKSNQSANKVDFVITHKGSDIAISYTKSYGYYGYAASGGENYQVFSYSDRPVYRPGDVVHYKAVIRKKDTGNYTIPTGTFYAQVVFDNDTPGPNISYKALVADQHGTVTFDTTLPQMTTGINPQITLSVKNSDGTYNQIDSLPVAIQNYRKPDMDITTTTNEKEYISSDKAHFTVSAKTNYGQPLSNVDFSYRVLVSDFSEVKDRTTEDISAAVSGYYGQGDELVTGKGKFDGNGVAQITFSTSLPSKYELSQIATLEITPNIGASPSIGKIAKFIHRGEFALFVENLSGDTDNGVSGRVTVMNHNTPRIALSDKPVTVSLYKIVDYDTKQLLQTQNVTSGADGSVNFSFAKVDTGSYEVVAQATDNRKNTVTDREQVYVGQQQRYSSGQSQYSLSLTTQKSSYKVNDTANVGVMANFAINDAIVILTNDGGNSSNIIKLSKNHVSNSSWNLPVQIKDSYGQEVGIDIFTVTNGAVVGGHTNITIDKGQQKLKTAITFDKQVYKPGDTVSATITTRNQQGNLVSADNSLSVIDASLLQIGQLNGNVYDSFYGDTPYTEVAHYDSTSGIERNLGGGGGGCFLAGTQISMSNGETKNIEDVTVGDKILTRASDGSSTLVTDTVTNTYRHAVTDYLTINNSLNVTWIHRIFLNNAWHEAKDARIGDTLLDENGNSITITSITPHLGQFVVYNLTTSHYHTFFANGFYVHNDKGVGPRKNFVDTAYWNPHVQTDANGKATITFTLPDNLITFTAQAFSNTNDSQFGQATANFVSQKDYNIIPTIPNFYYQGDKPVVSALIQNASNQAAKINITLTVKELGVSKSQTVSVNKGDFGTAAFPIDITKQTGTVSILIEAKDMNGNTLDSVLVKKPILPKGNISSSWLSFQGSKNISYTATYPTLDFNKVNLSVVPNVVTGLFQNATYLSSEQSIAAGQDVYAYSYILAKTREGEISPTSYKYAKLKNDFRDLVATLMQKRSGDHWNLPPYSNEVSFDAMNLWIAQGLLQANNYHMLDEINNIPSISANTEHYIKSSSQPSPGNMSSYYSPEDILAREWFLNQNIPNQNSPESLAVKALQGYPTALGQLASVSLPTANDRYMWDGRTQYSQILPALAMVQKGSIADADKAIKGLSFALQDSPTSPLALLAGVLYAERNNLYIDMPTTEISVNGQVVYTGNQDQQNSGYTQDFLAKNTNDGKIALHIATSGDVPVYSTVVQTDYTNQALASYSGLSFIDKGLQFLGLGNTQTTGKGKIVDLHLKRTYKDVRTGQEVAEIKQGNAGIVALTGTNQFAKYVTKNQSQNNAMYSFILEDAISPSYIYLNQTQDFSNSPQYESVMDKFYPGNTMPSDYSDEAAFFTGALSQSNLVLPYVVYNASGGKYYQPKTTIVFPILGLISLEK